MKQIIFLLICICTLCSCGGGGEYRVFTIPQKLYVELDGVHYDREITVQTAVVVLTPEGTCETHYLGYHLDEHIDWESRRSRGKLYHYCQYTVDSADTLKLNERESGASWYTQTMRRGNSSVDYIVIEEDKNHGFAISPDETRIWWKGNKIWKNTQSCEANNLENSTKIEMLYLSKSETEELIEKQRKILLQELETVKEKFRQNGYEVYANLDKYGYNRFDLSSSSSIWRCEIEEIDNIEPRYKSRSK